ncbi:MAG: hypothetical protein EOM91_15505 [Sphingobacteriia bacterium]|nr:hypothetical protein [Sphingobacteriia bacterium]
MTAATPPAPRKVSTNLAVALAHAAKGRRVFPCDPKTKRPSIKKTAGGNGFKDATTDPDIIRAWWTAYPNAAVGMPTGGRTGVFVVDVDVKDGKVGEDTFAAVLKVFGPLPDTIEAMTATGGRHLYFRHPRDGRTVPNKGARLGTGRETWGRDGYPEVPFEIAPNGQLVTPDLDIRGDGGYVILPGSQMTDGRTYEWEGSSDPDEGAELADAPLWLLALICVDPSAEPTAASTPGTDPAAPIGEGGRNEYLFRLGCSLRAKGMTEQGIIGALLAENAARCVPPLPDPEVIASAKSAASKPPGLSPAYAERAAKHGPRRPRGQGPTGSEPPPDDAPIDFEKNSKGRILRTIGNLKALLEAKRIRVRFNVMSKDLEIDVPDLEGTAENRSEARFAHIESLCGSYGVPSGALPQFLLAIGDAHAVNPPADWIVSAPWDGQDRFPDLFETLQLAPDMSDAQQALSLKLIRRWMLAAAAAAIEPGGFVPHGVLILVGKQGIGKTSWFRRLVPEGVDWLLGEATLDLSEKDDRKRAISHWIVELAELDGTFRRSDVVALKAFITTPVDELRLPYARTSSRYPRRTAFCGSVNDARFLIDRTGNRRYWPIHVSWLDYEHRLNIQQLWAQAAAEYRRGDPAYLDRDEIAELETANEGYAQADPIAEKIMDGFDWTAPPSLWRKLTATQIADELGLRLERGGVSLVGTTLGRIQPSGGPIARTLTRGLTRYLMPPAPL